MRYLIEKVVKTSYQEFEEKRMLHFDIFKMKSKNYDKTKEQKKLQMDEFAKTFKYRKLRALYGTRPTSQILKGLMDDDDDNS